jgi:hypothetical protein
MQTTFAIQVQGDHWLVEWLIAFLASLAEEPIILLTMVLIAVTGFYAFATWKTFNVLKKDLEHRVQPIVSDEGIQKRLGPLKCRPTGEKRDRGVKSKFCLRHRYLVQSCTA